MRNVLKWLDKHFEEVILVFATMVMILLIFLQVIMRYLFNSSLAWSEELARYVFVWQVWMAVPYAVIKGRHIRLEVLVDHVGSRGRFVLDMIFFLVSAAFFVVMGIYAVGMVQNVFSMHQTTPALQIPKWLCYLAVPCGCLMGAVRFLEYGWRRICRFRKDPDDVRTIAVDS